MNGDDLSCRAHAARKYCRAVFGRNTVVVFIAHMPVYYLMQWTLVAITSYAVRVTLEFFVCFVVLAVRRKGFAHCSGPMSCVSGSAPYVAPVLDGDGRSLQTATTGLPRAL